MFLPSDVMSSGSSKCNRKIPTLIQRALTSWFLLTLNTDYFFRQVMSSLDVYFSIKKNV